MYARACLLGSILCCLAAPAPARAHGIAPAVTQILPRARDTVLATTRGLVFGGGREARWSLLCGSAFGVPDEMPYRVAALPSGALLVASLEGLVRSDDDGCTWQPHPTLGDSDVPHLLQDPARPERILLSVFGGAQAGIHASDDGGLTFRRLYAAPAEELVGSLRVGASGAIFAAVATAEEVPRFFVLRTTDGGATWARTELALGSDVLDVGLLATNPAAPDEVLLRVFRFDQRAGDDLLRSTDGGASFAHVGRFLGLADATFAPDGSAVFVASGEGLMRARTSDYAFARVGAATSASHVTWSGDAVLAGVAYPEGALVMPGVVKLARDAAAAPARWMTFAEVTTSRACAPPSTVACACELAWVDWAREYPGTAASPAPACTP